MRDSGFFRCDCYGHGLAVCEDDGLVYLSFWREGVLPHSRSWRDRLSLIWKILRTGEPYYDQFVIRKEHVPYFVALLQAPPPL